MTLTLTAVKCAKIQISKELSLTQQNIFIFDFIINSQIMYIFFTLIKSYRVTWKFTLQYSAFHIIISTNNEYLVHNSALEIQWQHLKFQVTVVYKKRISILTYCRQLHLDVSFSCFRQMVMVESCSSAVRGHEGVVSCKATLQRVSLAGWFTCHLIWVIVNTLKNPNYF